MYELIEIHEQEQDTQELKALDPVQSEDRIMVGSLTEDLILIEKEKQILENRVYRRLKPVIYGFEST
ncbi:hypothetical protein TNCV_3256041 [Trichonephila clavipes]|nr:hypothetical protein TNCV_3256041 [Trichonephila clavipes]